MDEALSPEQRCWCQEIPAGSEWARVCEALAASRDAAVARADSLAAEHADCSNLSHAEASRIFGEAKEMRAERDDLAREHFECGHHIRALTDHRDRVIVELHAAREAFHVLVCNAEGYDKSIVRTMAIWMRAQVNEQYRRLGERVLAAEEHARRFSRCQDVHPIGAAARPDDPTTEGGAPTP